MPDFKKCQKCKSQNLQKEPACTVCNTCGWVKYQGRGNRKRLVRQAYINKQFRSNTHMIQMNSLYAIEPNAGSWDALSEDEQGILEHDYSPSLYSILDNEDGWFLEKEGLL